MNTHVNVEHSQEILREMCQRVGADYDTFDFSKHEWFYDYEWTEKEQNDFIAWLAAYLRKKKYVRLKKYRGRDAAIHEAEKIVFNYGWKTKYE